MRKGVKMPFLQNINTYHYVDYNIYMDMRGEDKNTFEIDH